MKKIEEKLISVGNTLATQRHLRSISYGLMAIMPLTIFGSIFQLISALPDILPFLPAWSESAKNAILFPYNMAFGLFGVIAVVAIAYYHARSYELDQIQATIVSLISFMVVAAPIDSAAGMMNAGYLGSQGIFVAIFVALIAVEIMRFMEKKNIKIKLPDSIPPVVAGTFNAIIPMCVIVTVFYLLSLLCQAASGQLLPELLMTVLSPVINASESLWFCMLAAFLIALLQFFGVHGFNVLSGIILPLMITNTGLNAEAYAAGETATKIFTLPMFQMSGMFVWIIPLLLLCCKSEQAKAIGKISLVPSIFNIAEPIQYGAPIMFNPILGVPWVIMFTVNMGIVWCSMYFGICNKAVIMASSNVPFPIFYYLCTLDWRSVLVFAVMLVFSYFLWVPFIRAYDRKCLAEEGARKEEVKEG